ncbi:MAG: hypothetical protein IK136_05495 [Oscillospiraceae bacterium]|nr:hypothetical protein [Oscillospiraceae bacterium]
MKKAPVLLLAAFLLCLAACAGGESPAVSPSPAETPPAAAPTPSPEPVAVVDLISETGVYSDSVGNTLSYSYRLPLVTGGADYANAVNEEIREVFLKTAESEHEAMKDGLSLFAPEIGYETYGTEDVLSLFIYLHNDWGQSEYRCYNFAPDGGEVTNGELLALAGMTEEDFVDAARGVLTEATAWRDAPEELRGELDTAQQRTLAEDNCSASMPMFLNGDGCLSFIARVYSVAGADYYYHIYSICG